MEEEEKVSEEIEQHHHKNKKHHDLTTHHKSQDSKEIVHEGKTNLRKHYNKKKLTQGIFLATVAGLLTIYFFVMYALSTKSFQKMSESL